ncbi:MAG: hypothetical protein HYS13_04070 [Planctomycetia bacterium]|nr:hypothetical protein [Planctomycetia bacterium]
MSGQVVTDLLEFRQFLDAQIASGRANLTPEETVRLWRESRREFEETVAELKDALADVAAGDRGVPAGEFMKDLRARNYKSAKE